jgi:cytidylate kinase
VVVVAISGQPGSGKSTLAREIARALGLPLASSGALFRELASKMGFDFVEFHRHAERNHEIDRMIDSMAVERARSGSAVLEGHLVAWIVRPYADVCIYLKASREVRARRVALRDGRSFEEALREIAEREELNRRRYIAIYGIDVRDLSIFDLVLDTTRLTISDVVRIGLDLTCTLLNLKYAREICMREIPR